MNQSIYFHSSEDTAAKELPTMTDEKFALFNSSIETNNDLKTLRAILRKHGIENKALLKDLYAFDLIDRH